MDEECKGGVEHQSYAGSTRQIVIRGLHPRISELAGSSPAMTKGVSPQASATMRGARFRKAGR
jgi:hypothetical protein